MLLVLWRVVAGGGEREFEREAGLVDGVESRPDT
jgi:hypothetical protein